MSTHPFTVHLCAQRARPAAAGCKGSMTTTDIWHFVLRFCERIGRCWMLVFVLFNMMQRLGSSRLAAFVKNVVLSVHCRHLKVILLITAMPFFFFAFLNSFVLLLKKRTIDE